MNVALYGRTRRWCMTERGQKSLSTGQDHLTIGPSRMEWDGKTLCVQIDEVGMPIPQRVRGTIRLTPRAVFHETFLLNPDGTHLWRPIAPLCDVVVALENPALTWHGTGYLDHNRGDAPIATGFKRWDWSRLSDGVGAQVIYEGLRADDAPFALALGFTEDGCITPFTPPPPAALPPTRLWRMPRATRCDAEANPRVLATFEDTPFYSRSHIATLVGGQRREGVHESLSATRLDTPITRAMLPFRMPRRG
jgi:carotenoid 1,2-hydratase